jgi:hypothetical protein
MIDLAAAQFLPLLGAGFFQVCYVTSDLDAGMRQLAALHGIERFRVRRDVPSLPGMPRMTLHQAHVYLGDLQLELIQPAGGDDAIYRDFCAADGTVRHHHHGLWIDDQSEFASMPGRCAALGVPIAMEIAVPGVGGAIYADFRRVLGHYVEYVHLAPDVKARYYADVPRH